MRLLATLVLGAAFALTGASAAAAHGQMLETDTHTFPITKAHRVHVHFPVGQLRVIPTDEPRVQFDIRVRCRSNDTERCEELANQLVLDSHDSGNTLTLRIENYPKWNRKGFTVTGELRVPRAQALRVEMGVGELDIDGLQGDLEVDLGVGDADIRTTRASAAHVSVESGIGDATIRGTGSEVESSRFVGARATWSRGTGKSDVRLHVGVGDATVRLD